MKKVILGKIHVDSLSFSDALDYIEEITKTGKGGYIVTPNVDHIVLSETNTDLQSAYCHSSLSLADGKPLIWMSKIIKPPLPEKISGSDLIIPLLKRAAANNFKVYFLGSAPTVGITAAEILKKQIPHLKIVGVDSPPMGFDSDPEKEIQTLQKMLSTDPDIVLMALGAPKQELIMHKWYNLGITPVMLGIGAGLDFISGKVKRSPKWLSNWGLEWLFRLLQDPKRLAGRYLIRDLGIIPIFCKTLIFRKQNSDKL